MKHNPTETALRQRLERGGFLEKNAPSLEKIFADNEVLLAKAQIDVDKVGAILEQLHEQADAAMETAIPVLNGKATIRQIEVMGLISCPFNCGHRAHKADLHLIFADGEDMHFSPLSIHFLKEHRFLEGKNSPYRFTAENLRHLQDL